MPIVPAPLATPAIARTTLPSLVALDFTASQVVLAATEHTFRRLEILPESGSHTGLLTIVSEESLAIRCAPTVVGFEGVPFVSEAMVVAAKSVDFGPQCRDLMRSCCGLERHWRRGCDLSMPAEVGFGAACLDVGGVGRMADAVL